MEAEIGGYRIQGAVGCAHGGKPWAIHSRTAGPCWDYEQEGIEGTSRVTIVFVDSDTIHQLYAATLDNTGNNNTTCKTIEDIHIRRGLEWNSAEQQLPYVISYCELIIS